MNSVGAKLLLGFKPEKLKDDETRERERIGKGLWMPGGGADEPEDLSHEHSACREYGEEYSVNLDVSRLKKVVLLTAYWPTKIWVVHTYITILTAAELIKAQTEFDRKTFEKVELFPLSSLPFDVMLDPDKEWMPRVFSGEVFDYDVWFDEKKKMKASRIMPPSF